MSLKLQSAMEYLMTYGWAIFVIGIIIVTLNGIGVFNLGLAASAQQGSCQVIRPQGQGTSNGASVVGTCNIRPKEIAYFNGNGYVNFGSISTLSPEAGVSGKMTLCLWDLPSSASTIGYNGPMMHGGASPSGSGGNWEFTFDTAGNMGFAIYNLGGSNVAQYS